MSILGNPITIGGGKGEMIVSCYGVNESRAYRSYYRNYVNQDTIIYSASVSTSFTVKIPPIDGAKAYTLVVSCGKVSRATSFNNEISYPCADKLVGVAIFDGNTLVKTGAGVTYNGVDESGNDSFTIQGSVYDQTMSYMDNKKYCAITLHAAVLVSANGVPVPTIQRGAAYTDKKWSLRCVDDDYMTYTGTISATDAGDYSAVFSLKSGYTWADGTTEPKTVNWSIAKAAPSKPSFSPSSITLSSSDASKTFTVSRSGDGEVSAVSSDPSVATVSVSDRTVTVTRVAAGTATVTVTVGEGTNYLAYTNTDATVAVTVSD